VIPIPYTYFWPVIFTDKLNFAISDTIGNKGAFIRLKGDQMVPKYITYEAVVSGQQAYESLKAYSLAYCRLQTSN
jgi:hypothetical protein